MKKWLFILFPFWCLSQSYVVPNINAKGIMANVCDDTLKISSLAKIKKVEVFSDSVKKWKLVNGHTYNLPLSQLPNGRHTLSVVQDKKMYIYWLFIGRLETE